jgi:hypothetical protein
MDGRRENVVGRLAEVDVVVGMDRASSSALAGGGLIGDAGDDLVGVHVGRGAAAGLEDIDDELAIVPPLGHGGRGGDDPLGDLGLE